MITTIINLDEAIEFYNNKNKNKKPLNQKDLASFMPVKVNKQTFTEWKKNAPKSIIIAKAVSEITGYPLEKLITTENKNEL